MTTPLPFLVAMMFVGLACGQDARAPARMLYHMPWSPSAYEAVIKDDAPFLHRLLEAGVSASVTGPDHDTPLCAALRSGKDEMADDLLRHGADVKARGALDEPPIALATLRRHPALLRALLDAGADANAAFGKAILESTINQTSSATLKRTLARERGLTPLMLCSLRGDVEGVAMLLAHGADTERRTEPRHRYAIEFAADEGYLYIMRLLLGRKPDSEPHVLITVNLETQRAKLQIDGVTKLSTSISTGRAGYETPAGRYVITHKYEQWNSTIYKVPMPYFLRLNCGPIGLHSGYVTGSPASHGCIRLPHGMAVRFFQLAHVGDEVIIQD